MWPVSDQFLALLRTDHAPVITARIGEVDLPIADGAVTLDWDGATRASLQLTLDVAEADLPLWVPESPTDLLAPYGNEITVGRGIGDEIVPLGEFRIDETTTDDDGDVGLTVTALDRSAIIIDAVFEDGGTIAAGADAATTIQNLIALGGYDATYSDGFLDVPVALPALSYAAGDDRWDFCKGLASAIYGAELYFDSLGVLTLGWVGNKSLPDYRVAEGEDGTILGASKRWGREDACNRVVVTGETSGETPVSKDAKDENPGSPTNYSSSKFGRVTFSYSSDYIKTEAQAQTVANTILRQKLGTGQQITFEALVNPALRPGDVVEVVRERIGVSELHIIDSLTIPLAPGGRMQATTRVAQVS